jgi:hypothetical protein
VRSDLNLRVAALSSFHYNRPPDRCDCVWLSNAGDHISVSFITQYCLPT